MKVLPAGQCVKHALFGIGVATGSNEERTTIDFYEHGRKIFVTHMLEAELVAEAPPRPGGSKARPRKKAAEAK
jgi:hypothetical protein